MDQGSFVLKDSPCIQIQEKQNKQAKIQKIKTQREDPLLSTCCTMVNKKACENWLKHCLTFY